MPLTKLEREAITDSMLKIQSIQASLEQVDDDKLIDIEEIHECLENADNSFRHALKNGSPEEKPSKR
jgi:hypothetical protein